MSGPTLPCCCGAAYQPTAALDGLRRKWRCACGREGWRDDREGAALYGLGDAERVLPVVAAEVRRGQLALFGGAS